MVSCSATLGHAQILLKEIPDKLVVLTFDDASASHYSVVAPLLKHYGFGGTFFICEFPPNFSDTARYMNWRQIKELDRMGFEIGNHTKNHPMLSNLPTDQVDYQLSYIDKKCDSMNIKKPVTFAYPGYALNSTVVELLKGRGYTFARIGGDRPFNPLVDHPLLVPSWAMNANNREQIMNAFAEAKDGRIVVLTIHGVPDVEHFWVTTPPELFNEYLEFLHVNNYRVVSLRDLSEYINTEEALRSITPVIPDAPQKY